MAKGWRVESVGDPRSGRLVETPIPLANPATLLRHAQIALEETAFLALPLWQQEQSDIFAEYFKARLEDPATRYRSRYGLLYRISGGDSTEQYLVEGRLNGKQPEITTVRAYVFGGLGAIYRADFGQGRLTSFSCNEPVSTQGTQQVRESTTVKFFPHGPSKFSHGKTITMVNLSNGQ